MYNSMGGFREVAARNPSRVTAHTRLSRVEPSSGQRRSARTARQAMPQARARAAPGPRRSSGCMHARGSTPHPRRHRRHTNTNSNPTHHHQKHTGRAGGHSRNRYTEQGTRPPKRTVDAQQTSPNPCLLPKGTRNEPIGPKPETPRHYKDALPHTPWLLTLVRIQT